MQDIFNFSLLVYNIPEEFTNFAVLKPGFFTLSKTFI